MEFMLDISRYLSIIREYGLSQMQFWIIALLIGIASGLATLGFRLAITYLQFFSYGGKWDIANRCCISIAMVHCYDYSILLVD